MLTDKESKRVKFIINVLFTATVLGLIYFFMKFVFFWIFPFVIAIGICFLIEPIIQWFVQKLKWKRGVASGLVVTILAVILLGITALISTTLISEMHSLLGNMSEYIDHVITFIEDIPNKYSHIFAKVPEKNLTNALEFLKNYDYSNLLSGSIGTGVVKYAGGFLTSIPSMIVYIIVTIASTYFSAASFPAIKRFIINQFTPKTREVIIEAKHQFFNTIVKYLKSYFVLLMITFAELSVAFLIFGIQPAVTLAFVISLVDILPVLGVGTVLIPWSAIELLLGNPLRALTLICIYLIVTIIRQILEPKVIGDHVGMLPILTLFCIYVGLQLFGILGMFLLPITVIVIKNLHDDGKIKIWK